jgi:hypothetical protein
MARTAHRHHHDHHHNHPNQPDDPAGGAGGGGGAGDAGGGGGAGDPAGGGTANAADFAQLGATFNDATRALVGGLWQNAVEEGGQGNGSVFKYVNDLQAVQSGLQADVAAGDFTGASLTNIQTVLKDLTTAISAASASVNGGGSFGSVAAAEKALHDSHVDILNVVNNDPNLAALATADGAAGFMQVPSTLPNGVAAATAPHDNLAEIGAIFNDAANQILGGVNAGNSQIITDDINAVITDMQQLMQNHPELFGGLTGIHAETVVRQLELEGTYIKDAAINPDAARGSNDNILDIIDIVQGDTNLANMASQGGVNGFSPFPDFANPTPKYQDSADQTNFWANFMAQSNSLGQQAQQIVGSGDAAAINNLITELQTFQKNATDFDASQGGIFGARFDNELLGDTSTLGAEVAAMVKGLQTGNAALVTAAAEEMHANAADVSGNNIPVTGGTFNPDGLTVAEVLSTAVATPAVAAAAPATQAAANAAAGAGDAGASASGDSHGANGAAEAPLPGSDPGAHFAHGHHFEHMWG